MHSTFNTMFSSDGGLLRGVSTVWSVESLLEQEKKEDSCCVVVWCIAERTSLL